MNLNKISWSFLAVDESLEVVFLGEVQVVETVCWGFYGRSGGTSISAFPQDPAGSW